MRVGLGGGPGRDTLPRSQHDLDVLAGDLHFDQVALRRERVARAYQYRLQRHRDRADAAIMLGRGNAPQAGAPESELFEGGANRRAALGQRVQQGAMQRDPLNDVVRFQPAQAVGQQVLRDAGQARFYLQVTNAMQENEPEVEAVHC